MSDQPENGSPYRSPSSTANTPGLVGASTPEPDQQLSVGEKVGYGLGDTASNLYWKLFENFQLYFYTDVFGIGAASAATMFFVTKLWDAFNDPMVGFISDRTKTAWGRFRPYLIWMSIPFAITGMMTFYTPDLSANGKLIYAYITYTLVFMAYTAVNIPYGALMGVISSNSLERTSVSTYRFVLAFLGGLVVQTCTEPLVAFFGNTLGNPTIAIVDGVEVLVPDKQVGFFWTVVCYAVIAMILFWITFATTRERVQPVQSKNNRFMSDVRDLLGNRPWLVLLGVGLFQILADWTRGSAISYYFTYYVGSEFGWFLATATIAGILGMLMTKPLTQAFGKKNLLIAMNIAKAVLTALFFMLGPEQVYLMYTLNIVMAFITGPIPILLWAMYADVADYSEYQNNRRATGLVFAAATFSQKMGSALGAAVPGWTLAYFSFVAPIDGIQQTQTDQTIDGIILMMSLIPAVLMFGAIFALFAYNLTEDKMKQIEAELKRRKQAEKGNETLLPNQTDSNSPGSGE
ncbi:MAG: MFS transporter [Planctomycetota bacterium]